MGETQKRGIKGGNEIKLGLIEKKTGSFVRERGENNQMKFFLQEFALIQTLAGKLEISAYSKFPIRLPRCVFNSFYKSWFLCGDNACGSLLFYSLHTYHYYHYYDKN